MIDVKPSESWRFCNVCAKKAAICLIFRSDFNNMGNEVALCSSCATATEMKLKYLVPTYDNIRRNDNG